MDEYGPKMAKKSTVMQISEKTYLDLKFKNKCGQKTSTFNVERPLQRYGRLKSIFMCGHFLQCDLKAQIKGFY